jgi:predicted GTPase
LTKQIKTIDYSNVESIVANDFLFGNLKEIVHHLKTKHRIDDSFVGIPSITIAEENNLYCISVTGIQAHHDEFKLILRRIQTLSNVTQSAKSYYQRKLNAVLRSINHIITQQIHSSQDWKYYTKYFQERIQNKINEFVKLFHEYLSQKVKDLMEQCITDSNFQSWIQLRKLTSSYMEIKPFEHELEQLKHQALEEFIKQHVFSERLKFEKKPSLKSLQTMHEFINKVKNEIYVGCQLEQLKQISKLLERIMLYYRCFSLQLPLYESSKELLEKIKNNTVITISTSTGSGKSSLLPALLIAEDYEKVIVTQPRRLPCQSISRRVNETMTTNQNNQKLAGWAVSGDERDVKARILYLTDGLLKERLIHDENLIPNSTKSIIFFIDEVHERSINIDLCLALIARLLTEKSYLNSKMKIIISSATLDSSVPNLFRQIPQIKVDEFRMPTLGTLYKIDSFPRPNENILDLVQELCRKRQRDDQILCFVSSTAEVNQCCQLLKDISHGTITAYPLIQSQSAADQQKYIEGGSIFFSTTVAETSLTFPSLKYVIDTGMINIPIYDFVKKQTNLREIRAAESTIKQRRGRLGRTKPGEYYSLYDFQVEDKKYPTPQICQSELVNIEFSLRKSAIQNGLNYMKQFLPNPPSPQAINAAIEELKRLRKFYPSSVQFES